MNKKIIVILLFFFLFVYLWFSFAKVNFCAKNSEIKIYMYHHIDTWSVDKTWSNRYFISPSEFDQHMQYIKSLVLKKIIYVASLSELEKFQIKWCFPNAKIAIFTVDDGWKDAYKFLYPIIQKYWIKFDYSIISKTLNNTWSNNPYLTKQEIKEMMKSWLVEIQSHSVNHYKFEDCDIDQVQYEVCESKKILEETFDIKINSFIYPYWHFIKDDFRFLKRCWYYYWASTTWKPMNKKILEKNRYQIFRIEVDPGVNYKKLFSF